MFRTSFHFDEFLIDPTLEQHCDDQCDKTMRSLFKQFRVSSLLPSQKTPDFFPFETVPVSTRPSAPISAIEGRIDALLICLLADKNPLIIWQISQANHPSISRQITHLDIPSLASY